jgi:hypothetical protein
MEANTRRTIKSTKAFERSCRISLPAQNAVRETRSAPTRNDSPLAVQVDTLRVFTLTTD